MDLRAKFLKARLLSIVYVFLVSGCATYSDTPSFIHAAFIHDSQEQKQGELSVRVSAPSPEESYQLFGIDFESKGIRPIWVEVRNCANRPYWLSLPAFDSHYYSPLEAAFLFHKWYGVGNKKIDKKIQELAFKNPIDPHSEVSGFVFGDMVAGVEMFNADFFAVHDFARFTFQLTLPGLDTDAGVFNESLVYKNKEMEIIENEETLRKVLSQIPCCSTSQDGKKNGDPLNIVMIGDLQTILSALARRGWHQSEFITPKSTWATIKSYFTGTHYPQSPVSALYYRGRYQDIAVQKVRGNVQQRIHMRLWLAAIRYKNQSVYIAQVSRDIGVKFWNSDQGITTHVIDPDIDEARASLVSDLAYSEALSQIGYVTGVEAATEASGRQNLSGDAYYTDGLRAVLFFGNEHVDIKQIKILPWEAPPWDRFNTRKFNYQVK